jgi:hypothetical protein
MIQDTVRMLVVDHTARAGSCELCAANADPLTAEVVVEHTRGGQVRFTACTRCTRAARRLASAMGGSGPGGTAVVDSTVEISQPAPVAHPLPNTTPLHVDLTLELDHPVFDTAGRPYTVRVRGGVRADGTWIGWIEFTDAGTGAVLRTDRETTQSNREALTYWATGLEPAYLEGAFARAR